MSLDSEIEAKREAWLDDIAEMYHTLSQIRRHDSPDVWAVKAIKWSVDRERTYIAALKRSFEHEHGKSWPSFEKDVRKVLRACAWAALVPTKAPPKQLQ